MAAVFANNSLQAWLIALALSLATWVGLWLLRSKGLSRFQTLAATTRTGLDDAIAGALRATRWWFYLWVSVYVGGLSLEIVPSYASGLETVAGVAVLLQGTVWLLAAIKSWLAAYEKSRADTGAPFRLGGTVTFVSKLVIWCGFALLLLENLGVDVSALVAGLGVGGIAVALAVQNVLGDLFASLSIALDQPFVPGDFIAVGEEAGTVEETGLKTTRVRSISGEQLLFSNTDLLKSRIRNYGRMEERRVAFTFSVPYDTPRPELETIPALVEARVAQIEAARFGRCHLKALGESSLVYEAVYFMNQPAYDVFMDTQQDLCLNLLQDFRDRKIKFGFPTQTLHLHGGI